MSRVRPADEPFSLFPFLGIMASVLGVLVMIVLCIAQIAVGPGKGILPVAEASSAKRPVYVEWDGDAVTIHPVGDRVLWAAASAKEGQNDTPFGQLLAGTYEHREQQYLVFLVRPSGFDNFAAVEALVADWQIEFGYEPINQEWDIRTHPRRSTP